MEQRTKGDREMPSPSTSTHIKKAIRRAVTSLGKLGEKYAIEARKSGVPEWDIDQALLDTHFSAYVDLMRVASLTGLDDLEAELQSKYRQPQDTDKDE